MIKSYLVALFVLLVPVALLAEEAPSIPLNKKVSPHSGKGNCRVCHVETEEGLNAWSFFGASKRKMKADHNAICTQCHGLEFGHGVGQTPRVNIDNLPLDENNKITCALTCHDMHIKAEDPKQTFYHLRLPPNRICESCHHSDR